MKNNSKHNVFRAGGGRFLLLLAASLWLDGCSQMEPQAMVAENNADVKVLIDAGGCPAGTDPANVELSRGKRQGVTWEAVDKSSGDHSDAEFSLYYNPFVGPDANRRSKHGVLRTRPVYEKIPVDVEYKYTIVTDACPDKPYDPVITVRH